MQTSKIFSEIWNINFKLINLYDELYTFNEAKLFNFVQNFPFSNKTLIIFGHNDAITDFVNKFGDIYIDKCSNCWFVLLFLKLITGNKLIKEKQKILFSQNIYK